MTAARERWRAGLALAAVGAGAALVRLRLAGVPLERDEGEFAYMGQLILRGEVPYLAAHNMKLPGAYYAYAAILALLGETDVAIRVGLIAVNLVSTLLIYALGRTLADVGTGLVAAAAFAVLSMSPAVLGLAAKAEHFVVLLVLAGALVLARPGGARRLLDVAAAGLLLGLAVVVKQHAAAFVVFGGLVVLRGGVGPEAPRWSRTAVAAACYGVAASVPLALTCLAVWRAGAFEPFWFWTVTYARQYATLIPLGTGLRHLGRQGAAIVGGAAALWLLVAVGAAATGWDRAARRSAVLPALLGACGLCAILPGWRFSEHYFLQIVPAASLFAGIGASAVARAAAARGAGLAAAARVGVPLAALALSLAQLRDPVLVATPAAFSRAVYGANPFPEAVEIARWLARNAAPEDRVAVIGSEPEIYFYARRRAATSYMYTYPLMEAQPFARRMQDDMIAQLEREPPRFLVLVNVDTSWTLRPDSPRLLLEWAERTVNERYRPVGLAEIVPGAPTVYRWGADAAEATPRSPTFVATFERVV